MNNHIKIFTVTLIFLSGASNAWAIDNVKKLAKPISERNFLVRLLQLDKIIMGQTIDPDKSFHSSPDVKKSADPSHLMIADTGETHVITKEKIKKSHLKKIQKLL